jgi:hypothetical protein
LLCAARKSRDADHLQNFAFDALAGVDADKIAADLLKTGTRPKRISCARNGRR